MSKRVQITHECDQCGATAHRTYTDPTGWVHALVDIGDDHVQFDACSKRCARLLLLIKLTNAELRDTP